MHTTAQFSIDDVRPELAGPVIGPGDPRYDTARSVMLRSVDRRPAAIVRPVDADEVSRVDPDNVFRVNQNVLPRR